MNPGAAVIIRVPNKLPLIRAGAWFDRIRRRLTGCLQDRIRFFNPAHAYVFSRAYLTRRLALLGFGQIETIPSPLLGASGRVSAAVSELLFRLLKGPSRLLAGCGVLTPSMVITASSPDPHGA
jgi:hypothetical protein